MLSRSEEAFSPLLKAEQSGYAAIDVSGTWQSLLLEAFREENEPDTPLVSEVEADRRAL